VIIVSCQLSIAAIKIDTREKTGGIILQIYLQMYNPGQSLRKAKEE
jgi:hypothetical protein